MQVRATSGILLELTRPPEAFTLLTLWAQHFRRGDSTYPPSEGVSYTTFGPSASVQLSERRYHFAVCDSTEKYRAQRLDVAFRFTTANFLESLCPKRNGRHLTSIPTIASLFVLVRAEPYRNGLSYVELAAILLGYIKLARQLRQC